MLPDSPCIILVTGIMASGKSTVAQLLAERFQTSAHVRGDVFRKMIVKNRKLEWAANDRAIIKFKDMNDVEQKAEKFKDTVKRWIAVLDGK